MVAVPMDRFLLFSYRQTLSSMASGTLRMGDASTTHAVFHRPSAV